MKNVLVLSLATYRATRLINEDEILREPREIVLEKLYDSKHPLAAKAAYFITCPWCVSIWAAGGLLLLKQVSRPTYDLVTEVLAASAVTGAIASRL